MWSYCSLTKTPHYLGQGSQQWPNWHWRILCYGSSILHCRVLSDTPSLYPKGASIPPDTAKCPEVWREELLFSGEPLFNRIKSHVLYNILQKKSKHFLASPIQIPSVVLPSSPSPSSHTYQPYTNTLPEPGPLRSPNPLPRVRPVTHSGLYSLFNWPTLQPVSLSQCLVKMYYTHLSPPDSKLWKSQTMSFTCH